MVVKKFWKACLDSAGEMDVWMCGCVGGRLWAFMGVYGRLSTFEYV